MEGLFVALAPGRGQLLKLLVALYLVKALLKNGALLIKIVATAVIAYAEVVASHIVLLHAIDLMDTSGCIAGRIANRATQLKRDIIIARHAFAIGIHHGQDGLAAECALRAAVHLSVGTLARFHRICRLFEPVISVDRGAIRKRFFLRGGGTVLGGKSNLLH